MQIRDEMAGDEPAIAEITAAAFLHHPFSHQTEHYIVAALRRAGALALSLVAVEDGRVVGHAAFSAVTISDGTPGWYGLGPISVDPACQGKGIGSALMGEGLSRLKSAGARGCALVGDPGFYKRFGFINPPALSHEGIPPEFVLALAFDGRYPDGQVSFHPAFMATE